MGQKKIYDFDFFHSYESLSIGLLLEYILKSVRLQSILKKFYPCPICFFKLNIFKNLSVSCPYQQVFMTKESTDKLFQKHDISNDWIFHNLTCLKCSVLLNFNGICSTQHFHLVLLFCQHHLDKPIYIYNFLCQSCAALPVRYANRLGALHKCTTA